MNSNDLLYLQMGYDVAEFKKDYCAESVIKFIKGEKSEKGEPDGSMYYYKLKKYYDKYGYSAFNEALLVLAKDKEEVSE